MSDLTKGDVEGHPFHGNQHTGGIAGGAWMPRKEREQLRRDVLMHGMSDRVLSDRMQRAVDERGGMTVEPVTGDDVTSGFAVGIRPDLSLSVKVEDFNRETAQRWLDKVRSEFADHRQLKIGAWVDTSTGMVWLDVVKVFPPQEQLEAVRAGRLHNQIAITNLTAIHRGKWGGAFINTGGTGAATKADMPTKTADKPTWILFDFTTNADEIAARVRGAIAKGDLPGHAFRGNQWTDGQGGSDFSAGGHDAEPHVAHAHATASRVAEVAHKEILDHAFKAMAEKGIGYAPGFTSVGLEKLKESLVRRGREFFERAYGSDEAYRADRADENEYIREVILPAMKESIFPPGETKYAGFGPKSVTMRLSKAPRIRFSEEMAAAEKEYRASVRKGDAPGHPFRGNQWVDGHGGSDFRASDAKSKPKEPRITLSSFSYRGGPFKETAFRNRVTGEVIGSGPQHNGGVLPAGHIISEEGYEKDPAVLKNHPLHKHWESGFIDRRGKFMTRREATAEARAWAESDAENLRVLLPKPGHLLVSEQVLMMEQAILRKGDYEGHPFRGNQYGPGRGYREEGDEESEREFEERRREEATHAWTDDEHEQSMKLLREMRDGRPTEVKDKIDLALDLHSKAIQTHNQWKQVGGGRSDKVNDPITRAAWERHKKASKEANEATEAAFEAIDKADLPPVPHGAASRESVVENIQTVAKKMGLPPAMLDVIDGRGPPFKLNGEEHHASGQYNPRTNIVEVFPDELRGPLEVSTHTVAHEIMHAKTRAMEDDPRFLAIVNDRTMQHDLIKNDGCSGYSFEYWKAVSRGEAEWHVAVRETLAEMAADKALGGNVVETAHPTWRMLYELVDKAKLGGKKARSRKA